MVKQDLVLLRDYVPDDKNLIMASWIQGLYYGDTWFSEIPKAVFMAQYHRVLEHIVEHPDTSIKIACLKEDPDVILGYAIWQGTTLHWVFVRNKWRKIGLAKDLVPTAPAAVTHLSNVGLSLMKRHFPKTVFNPFLIK